MHIAGYPLLKMKRKDFEDVNDEFSDFSLSSPARKIRRLLNERITFNENTSMAYKRSPQLAAQEADYADLPPIIEDEDREVPLISEESMFERSISSNIERVGGPVIEELPSVPENDERAIVLFKPMSTPLLHSPSNFSVSVSPDIIYGFKNQVLWSNQYNPVKPKEDEAADKENTNAETNPNLAVVPWIPFQLPPTQNMVPQAEPELMEVEEMEIASMDIEDNNFGVGYQDVNEFGGTSVGEGLHQWQQQHCMVPQLPQNTSTPIVWYR